MDWNGLQFQLVVLNVTGVPEFDMFFSLVFVMGMVMFVAAAPLRLFLNRWM